MLVWLLQIHVKNVWNNHVESGVLSDPMIAQTRLSEAVYHKSSAVLTHLFLLCHLWQKSSLSLLLDRLFGPQIFLWKSQWPLRTERYVSYLAWEVWLRVRAFSAFQVSYPFTLIWIHFFCLYSILLCVRHFFLFKEAGLNFVSLSSHSWFISPPRASTLGLGGIWTDEHHQFPDLPSLKSLDPSVEG
jgi:hypothetical protein